MSGARKRRAFSLDSHMATATPRAKAPAAAAPGPVPAPVSPGAEGPLDTTVRIVTPERIVFQYPLAGPFRRAFAYLIDLAVLCALVIVAVVVALLLSLGSISGMGPALVAYFALVWGYGAFCETVFNGQTPGKRAVGLRVVSEQGVPITGAQAVLRNLVGVVDGMLPFAYMLGLSSIVLTRRFQRLGDLAAGTMVVVEERPWRPGVVRVDEKEVAALLPWLPLRVAAGPELARALSDYVKRRSRFGPALREEMATPLARPLRRRFGLPDDLPASYDAVLCAVYHRVFLGE
jgi:uncharacterized RDD family membrane protein YckC